MNKPATGYSPVAGLNCIPLMIIGTMGNLKGFEKPKTVGETLYVYLKDAILTGDIKSGSRISERDIAQKFDVSVTPVREAFRRLAAEKFITINARTEVVVIEVTKEKIRELFEVITSLDLFASGKAIKNLTPRELEELSSMTKKLHGHHKANKIKEYMKLDLSIHEKIWNACGNTFLANLLTELGERYAFYCNNFITSSPDPPSYLLIEDHLNIIDILLDQKDEKKLEKVLTLHWGKGLIENLKE